MRPRILGILLVLLWPGFLVAQPPVPDYNRVCELINKPLDHPEVQRFFSEWNITKAPSGLATYKSPNGEVVIGFTGGQPSSTIQNISLDCRSGWTAPLPGNIPPYSSRAALEKKVGKPGAAPYEGSAYYYYDKDISVWYLFDWTQDGKTIKDQVWKAGIWVNDHMKEYRVSGAKLGIQHPSTYRYIKYNNGPHPNPVPPDRLMPVETPIVFQYLRAWDRYGNKKVVLKGSQSQTLGRITGKLFVDGRLHMEGTFMASNGEASWIPDPGVLMTLYDKGDSTIRLEARFKQYNAILPGEGSFYFRNKRYKVRYLGEYSLSYLTQDTLDNQLFIEHFKFLTRDGTLSADPPIELGSDHYANWFFHIRKPKAPPDPALTRREAANQKMNQVLNKAVDEMIARKDRNFYVVESERTYISGAGNYNKRFFPSSTSEIYMFFFIIPTRYLLNLRYETKVSYTSNGKVMEEKLPTPFEKFTLNSQLTGFRQVIALPPRPRDPGTYPSLTPTIWRLANNEDIPIRVILMKRSY